MVARSGSRALSLSEFLGHEKIRETDQNSVEILVYILDQSWGL